jgi:prophage maintenance system killer protein
MMKDLSSGQVFAGANLRTAFGFAKLFLRRNGRTFRVTNFHTEYPFIKNVGSKPIAEIEEWIERETTKESQ